MAKYYKLVVYVPIDSADKIRQVLTESGAGQIGQYDSTSFSIKGIGRFRPLKGAKPTIGEVGKLEAVEEERIETIVEESILDDVIYKIRKNHPYEEPVIDAWELIDK